MIHEISIFFFFFSLRSNILHGYTKNHWDVFERIVSCVESKNAYLLVRIIFWCTGCNGTGCDLCAGAC